MHSTNDGETQGEEGKDRSINKEENSQRILMRLRKKSRRTNNHKYIKFNAEDKRTEVLKYINISRGYLNAQAAT